MKEFHFPKGFLWGTAMSSHQVEGNTKNDWTEWEKSEKRLKHLHRKGHIKKHGLDNFISGESSDHFRLFKEDYQMAREMGHNALRLSLEWSRIEPEEGKFSTEALEHYHGMIRHLRELGIEPLVTLWHWTIPLWLRDKGGWANPKTCKYFARYTQRTVDFLRKDVKLWITLNEPELNCGLSYLIGMWPPQKRNPYLYIKVLRNLIRGHRLAYDEIHRIDNNLQVGVATNNVFFEPYKNLPQNKLIVKILHWWNNHYFLNQIKDKQDFVGLNYYFHNVLHWGKMKNANLTTSDLGWELHPEGIYHLLLDLKKYHRPVYITENGLADATDKQRAWYIAQTLRHMHQAMEEGVDVRGYLHWSLLDNFEWHEGYYPRFGLVEIDYKTKKRTPRPSAHFYAEIIKKNHLNEDDLGRHMPKS